MAISSNAVFDLQRDQIIATAYKLCGVSDPEAAQVSLGSDLLNVGLKALQNEGIVLRTVERYTQTLTSGTAQYTAPTDTLDIDSPAYVTLSATTTDYVLTQISRDDYMEISDKTTSGSPTSIYVEKGSSGIVFRLYPTPDTTVTSITYARIRLLRDADTGTVTMDLPSKYLKTLIYMLATELSLHLGMLDRYELLESKYRYEKDLAVSDDVERGPIRFIPRYGRRF